jgi:exoribonuclease R
MKYYKMSERNSCLRALTFALFVLSLFLNYILCQVPRAASFQSVILPPKRSSKFWSADCPRHPFRSDGQHHTYVYAPLKWIPTREQQDIPVESNHDERARQEEDLKHLSFTYLAKLIQTKLAEGVAHEQKLQLHSSGYSKAASSTQPENIIIINAQSITSDHATTEILSTTTNFTEMVKSIVKGRFIDTTCTKRGEEVLEELFWKGESRPFQILGEDNRIKLESFLGTNAELYIIKGAILALQSLLIMGMQFGVKGTNSQIQQWVSHLEPIVKNYKKTLTSFKHDFFWLEQPNSTHSDWRSISNYIQLLKYERDTTGGMQLLAYLLKKRTPQGAFDLLVNLGVWEKHENVALLRSGFPTRFSEEEELVALEVEANSSNNYDVDTLLGLRKDLRHLKVYTIDSESTSEIDDGISLERYRSADGNTTDRLWIHIADVDRWAPRNSEIIRTAQRRSTTLYLPTGPVPMFPERYAY